jgi:hypothetical protein
VPMHDESGRMVGMAAILRDVTQRFNEMKALREQLAREQLAAAKAAGLNSATKGK